jgi:hypothetical protein
MRFVLALPARMGVRWLVILLIMVVATGVYGRVLATAPPFPPSQAPTQAPTRAAVQETGAAVTPR